MILMPTHYRRRRHAVLTWWRRECRSIFSRLGNFLAASFFACGHLARGFVPRDRASWCQDAVLVRWWRVSAKIRLHLHGGHP